MNRYLIPLQKANLVLPLWHKYCEEEMGKHEKTGNNDGTHITKYMNFAHLSGKKKYAYCASGLLYCLNKACEFYDVEFPFSKRSAVANFYYDDAKKIGQKSFDNIPQIYDLVVWKKPYSRSGHIESIKSPLNDLKVIDYAFNTSNGKSGSQREGNGNFIRERDLSSGLGKMAMRGLVGFYDVFEYERKIKFGLGLLGLSNT